LINGEYRGGRALAMKKWYAVVLETRSVVDASVGGERFA
jgi:hypothetical protein